MERFIEMDNRAKLLYEARKRAKEKSLPIDITIDDIEIPGKCPILGIQLIEGKNIGTGKGCWSANAPTLDRMLPSKGYVKGNICVISRRANLLKNDATLEQYKAILAYVQNWKELVPKLSERPEDFRSFADQIKIKELATEN